MSSNIKRKPRIGVFKFASCDGCQLTLLEAEDELLGVARAVDIVYFPEVSRAMLKGPYDIGLVGRIHYHSPRCPAHPGSQAAMQETDHDRGLCHGRRYPGPAQLEDVDEFIRVVYATPQYISTLKLSTPISEHVPVDLNSAAAPSTSINSSS